MKTPILGFAILVASAAFATHAQEPPTQEAEVHVRAIIVAKDLTLRPVPKRNFLIGDPANAAVAIKLSTDFQGEATVPLRAGSYVLRSEEPLEFEGSLFSWEVPFDLAPGARLELELSNDNATIEASAPTAVALDEGELYRRYKGSVFKVLSESGHGSGFLVDSAGLVLTNHHVIAGSDYLAVKVDEKRKYPALVVADDPANDLAVLHVNPESVAGLGPLQLASDTPDVPSVSVGERVLAIGSPLATETILTSGLVSKIEDGAIYSDVSINPGNSGGPLFSSRGEVIGVNTFGLRTQTGPGVSGIVRIHLARAIVAEARQAVRTAAAPPARLLPVESSFSYPPEELRRLAMAHPLTPKKYHLEAGKIDVQLITPVVIASLEVASEMAASEQRSKRSKGKSVKPYKPGEDFYEWRRYAGDYKPVVTIQAVPEIRMTTGSAFAVAMLGANAPQKYRFKTDFERMELYRGDSLVEPIHPGRATQQMSFRQGAASMNDIGYYGFYTYPPEAFAPGSTLTIHVWRQGDPTPNVKTVDPEQQARIWSDFEPYFAALEAAAATTVD